jgi:hypothetical protein
MLLFIWGPFAMTSGMGWETYYTVNSETASLWRNFLYTPDPMRIHAGNFYELAYVLGGWVGARGSFVPYQILYAALWWARSFLGFLLIRRLIPKSAVLPFITGAIMLVHAPDFLIGWLGQLHQFGYFLWLLIALHLLVGALECTILRAAIFVAAGWLFQYLCLWTYEAPLPIILVAPVAFAFVLKRKLDRSRASVVAFWYVPSVIYLYLSYQRYVHMGGSGYQLGLMRKSFAVTDILSDWIFNVRYSLSFWSWQKVAGDMEPAQVFALGAGTLVVFAAAAFLVGRHPDERWEGVRDGRLWRLLCVGFVFLLLSFPVQLLLAGARELRRTQLLSAIAASIVLGCLVYLIAGWIPPKALRPGAAFLLVAPIVWFGACRVIERQASHRAQWNYHLTAMRDLVRGIGRLKDGTVVVMTNIPRDRDPFYAYAFWFNNALRLAYPRTEVAGVYYFADGQPEPSNNLRLSDNRWTYSGGGVIPLIQSAGIDQTLVLQFRRAGPPEVLPAIPPFVCAQNCSSDQYRPETRILPLPAAPEAARRYGPL